MDIRVSAIHGLRQGIEQRSRYPQYDKPEDYSEQILVGFQQQRPENTSLINIFRFKPQVPQHILQALLILIRQDRDEAVKIPVGVGPEAVDKNPNGDNKWEYQRKTSQPAGHDEQEA